VFFVFFVFFAFFAFFVILPLILCDLCAFAFQFFLRPSYFLTTSISTKVQVQDLYMDVGAPV